MARQKQRRGDYGCDHADAVGGHAAPGDQDSSSEQERGAGSVERGVERGEEGVLLGDRVSGNQAAGLVLRRLAMRNARPNITSENRSKVAIADDKGNSVVMPG